MSQYGSAGRRATAQLRAPVTIAITALVLAGCAQQSEQHEATVAAGKAKSASCQAERSRLVSLPEPDCEFRAVRQGTVDADEFARLKLAYERQCYQRAERAARRQLQELRTLRVCEGKLASR
jgi:hypothetical protein